MIVSKKIDLKYQMLLVKWSIIFSFIVSFIVFSIDTWTSLKIDIPFSILGIMGMSLALFIGLANNNANSRWWEGRNQWNIVSNVSRILGRLIVNALEAKKSTTTEDIIAQNEEFKRQFLHRQIAYANALRLQLRDEENFSILKTWLSIEEYQQAIRAINPANAILVLQGQAVKTAIQKQILEPFGSMQFDQAFSALITAQGTCEKLTDTPQIRYYNFYTRLFVHIYIFILPFCLSSEFVRVGQPFLVVPATMILSFIFTTSLELGFITQDPFRNKPTDVQITTICNQIERDMQCYLNEPTTSKIEPENGCLM